MLLDAVRCYGKNVLAVRRRAVFASTAVCWPSHILTLDPHIGSSHTFLTSDSDPFNPTIINRLQFIIWKLKRTQ